MNLYFWRIVCVHAFHMIEPNEQTRKFGFVYLLIAGQFQCGAAATACT